MEVKIETPERPGRLGLRIVLMNSDFTTFQFVVGRTYVVEIDPVPEAVQVTHHGEGGPEPQRRYGMLEYSGPVGSGPWRMFRDWETETDVTIDSHHITDVRESPGP